MNRATIVAALVATAAAGGGYWAGWHRGAAAVSASPLAAHEAKVLYWYDPMSPNQHFDRAGKSPFMDMPLVPRYADDDATARVEVDPQISQNLGMRLARVERGNLDASVTVAGVLELNDRDVAVVQARTGGFVQAVYARAPGDIVAQSAPLADVLVPEWVGAQEEFLAVLRSGDEPLAAAARQRMLLLGMPQTLIDEVARAGKSQPLVTLIAPIAGVLQELGVRSGMTLSQGATVAKINGLGTVWLDAAVPQGQAAAIGVGQGVTAAISAYSGQSFSGRVIAVLPQLDATSRTLRVRIELANRSGKLRPGMFAQTKIDTGNGQAQLLVPSEAIVRTGARDLVMLASGRGHYVPVAVRLGQESGARTVVLAGLNEGDQVVASGQFLLDSESSLRGILTREPPASVAPSAAAKPAETVVHHGTGKVESVNGREIVISHGPIATLGWGGMTMPFVLESAALGKQLWPGDTVQFGLVRAGDRYVINQLHKTGGAS